MKNINPERIYIINNYDPIVGNRYYTEIGRRIILDGYEKKVVGKSFNSEDQARAEIMGLEVRDKTLKLLKYR